MFPEPKTENTGSTALSIFIAILVLLLITGGISWFYFNSKSSSESVATTSDMPVAAIPDSTDPTVKTTPTDLAEAIDALDKELLVIGQDEQSDDDTISL